MYIETEKIFMCKLDSGEKDSIDKFTMKNIVNPSCLIKSDYSSNKYGNEWYTHSVIDREYRGRYRFPGLKNALSPKVVSGGCNVIPIDYVKTGEK